MAKESDPAAASTILSLPVSTRPITVTVLKVRGDRVTLGFDAGDEIAIEREEISDPAHTAARDARANRLHSNV